MALIMIPDAAQQNTSVESMKVIVILMIIVVETLFVAQIIVSSFCVATLIGFTMMNKVQDLCCLRSCTWVTHVSAETRVNSLHKWHDFILSIS